MSNNLSHWSSIKPFSIGFNSIFEEFDRLLGSSDLKTDYPSYNIHQVKDNHYKIEVGLAGFDKKDINIETKDNMLIIKSKTKTIDEKDAEEMGGVIYNGLAKTHFVRSFILGDHIKVNDASFQNGLLTIDLERQVPEEKKPKLIEIH